MGGEGGGGGNATGVASGAGPFCRGAFTDAADDLVDTIEDVSISGGWSCASTAAG